MNRSGPLPRGIALVSLSANESCGTATSVSGVVGMRGVPARRGLLERRALEPGVRVPQHDAGLARLRRSGRRPSANASDERFHSRDLGRAVEHVDRARIEPHLHGVARARRRRRRRCAP